MAVCLSGHLLTPSGFLIRDYNVRRRAKMLIKPPAPSDMFAIESTSST
jgi:hypothetical protein